MKKTKFLVRPSDFMRFEIDESNGCYRYYEKKPNKNRQTAYTHFSYDILVNNYNFIPVEENNIKALESYDKQHELHYKFVVWQTRSDGHGGNKGGTMEEYLEQFGNKNQKRLIELKREQENLNQLQNHVYDLHIEYGLSDDTTVDISLKIKEKLNEIWNEIILIE